MPTTVCPLDPMNSFGAYVASAATVSVPLLLIDEGTSATTEAVPPDPVVALPVADVAVVLLLLLLLLPHPTITTALISRSAATIQFLLLSNVTPCW